MFMSQLAGHRLSTLALVSPLQSIANGNSWDARIALGGPTGLRTLTSRYQPPSGDDIDELLIPCKVRFVPEQVRRSTFVYTNGVLMCSP